jgi:hypothetical protein
MQPAVAYVSDAGSADPDRPVALDAFRRAGLRAETVLSGESRDWSAYDLVLARSGWIRTGRHEFLRWAREVERHTALANPAVTLARTTDRTILRDLARRQVPTARSVWFEPGDDPDDLRQQLTASGWQHVTVSSNVSAGDNDVFEGAEEAVDAATAIAAGGLIAVVRPETPQQPGVRLSVVALSGGVSHAVEPDGSGGHREVEVSTTTAQITARVVRECAAGQRLLYVRADYVLHDGDWVLQDVATADHRLFLDVVPAAADSLAWAVRHQLTG